MGPYGRAGAGQRHGSVTGWLPTSNRWATVGYLAGALLLLGCLLLMIGMRKDLPGGWASTSTAGGRACLVGGAAGLCLAEYVRRKVRRPAVVAWQSGREPASTTEVDALVARGAGERRDALIWIWLEHGLAEPNVSPVGAGVTVLVGSPLGARDPGAGEETPDPAAAGPAQGFE